MNIYCCTNKESGKCYVGQTVDTVDERWREHVSAAERHKGCPLLGAAIRKYGPDAFARELLEVVVTQVDADAAEERWIERRQSRIPNGYNLAAGGRGPGYHHEDSKRRIGEASKLRLREMTPEQRAAHLKNIDWTPERRVRAKERTVSEEERKSVSDGQKAFWSKFTPEERSERVRHQLAGLSPEQKSERVRKAWSNLTPEARAERTRRAGAARSAARKRASAMQQTAVT